MKQEEEDDDGMVIRSLSEEREMGYDIFAWHGSFLELHRDLCKAQLQLR